jgi:hypothetical protein
MNVTVTAEDLVHVSDEGTVWVMTGTDTETRDRVRFASDWRAAQAFGEAVETGGEAVAEVEPWQVLDRQPVRRAVVQARTEAEAISLAKIVAKALPANYYVAGVCGSHVTIEGHDRYGWTLDGYVIPRLASFPIHASECTVTPQEA